MQKISFSSIRNASPIVLILTGVFVLSFFWNLYHVVDNWNDPILERHSFRQSQTALTAFWFIQDGIKIAYETPLFGPPWTIPFEFPTYQIVVAKTSSFFGIPIDQTGRLVSLLCFYLCLLPLYSISKHLNNNIVGWLITSSLLLTSPFYIFWSRSFMIESTALLLSATSSALFLNLIRKKHPNHSLLSLVAICSCLAALTKVTTFCVFWGFNLMTFFYFVILSKDSISLSKRSLAQIFAATSLLPLPIVFAWTKYTDILKLTNSTPMSEFISSSRLTKWNFGTIAQRLTNENWTQIKLHGIDYLLVSSIPLLFVLFLYVVIRCKNKLPYILILSFASGPLIFFNLYRVHDYYWYANGVFPFLFIGSIISNSLTNKSVRPISLVTLAILVIGFQIFSYSGSPYKQALSNTTFGTRVLDLAEKIKTSTNSNDTILIYGHDWNSSITYYSERKSIMTMTEANLLNSHTEQVINNLDSLRLFIVWNRKGNSPTAVKEAITRYGFAPEPLHKSPYWTIYSKI